MITTRYIDVAFGGARSAMARALYQYDYGQILRITDLALPFAYEVHFSDTKTGNSVTMIGNADGVEIPDACLLTSGNVYCWLYLHDTESDGETRYEVLIPILSRAKPTNVAPTPVQQDVIDQAIAALDAAVQQTGEDVIAAGASASAAAGSASDAEAWAVGERDGEPVGSDDPAYHNHSKYYAGEAASAAQTASQDAQTASDAAIAAGNAKTAAETAQGKAETAQEKAEAAQTAAEDAADQTALDVIAAADSADEASGYANTASGYASTASGYAIAAQGHAQDASGYASSASGYATNAYNSATAAAGSAGEASGYATSASGYASAANDAKVAAQGAQTAAETAQGLAEAAQTGAEAAQTAAETARDAAIAATEDKAPVILDSASGAIVSIVDGANGMNARSLVTSMSPIQDLHGQAAPYPAGGGKNKIAWIDNGTYTLGGVDFSFSKNVSALTVETNLSSAVGKRFGDDCKVTLPAGTYTLSSDITNQSNGSGFFAYTYGTTDRLAVARNGYPESFTLAAETVVSLAISIGAATTAGTYHFQLESGSSATAFAPYENICPISGRTGAEIWDDPAYGGNIEFNQLSRPVDSETTTYGVRVTPYPSDGYVILNNTSTDSGSIGGFKTISTVNGHKYAIFCSGSAVDKGANIYTTIGGNAGITAEIRTATSSGTGSINIRTGSGKTYSNDKMCICSFDLTRMFGAGNEPATIEEFRALFPHDYYPYNAGTQTCVSAVNGDPYGLYPVSWQTEAGTVYGGTVDIVSGVLTVTHGTTNMGNFNYISEDSSVAGLFRVANNEVTPLGMKYAKLQSSILKGTDPEPYNLVEMESVCLSNSEEYPFLRVRSASFVGKTADTVNSILSGQTLCYELKTPVTYQLTPTQIQMLLGANNLWSTGDSVSLTYPCDTRLYIERLTAPTEDDMVANANIPIHKFFMIGNSLYYSTAAIAQGAAIVVGTNCNSVSLADALNQLA